MTDHVTIDGCRSCGEADLEEVLALGEMPLADALVPPERADEPEPTYPLTVVFCPACSLVQILETVPPHVLFSEEYPYYSSFSDALVAHAKGNVDAIVDERGLGPDDLAIELASNDGYLLQWFVARDVEVLGIDPAPGPAAAAVEKGIPTEVAFFDEAYGRKLAEDGRRASVVHGNNVLAHVPDQNSFVAGIAAVLADDGVAVLEFPYVKDLVDHVEFDTIYHEHHCYFSVHAVRALFRRHGLELFRVQHHPIHGGSLRVFFGRGEQVETSVHEAIAEEVEAGLLEAAYYRTFADRVARLRTDLRSLLAGLKDDGASIVAYGAAAKGATMLNHCDIGTETLDYVVDRNTHKQGWSMPGVQLPILPVERLVEDRPDYALILAWNFAEEIVAQQQAYLDAGGRFIVPVPEPAIL